MKRLGFWGKLALLALLIVFVGGCAGNLATPRRAEESPSGLEDRQAEFDTAPSSDITAAEAAVNKAAPVFVVHIDPTTGEFRPEPPANEVTPAPAAKRPLAQFFEVSSPTPGGGVMIDLKGQFQTPLVATINADGKVTLKHEPTLPAEMDGK